MDDLKNNRSSAARKPNERMKNAHTGAAGRRGQDFNQNCKPAIRPEVVPRSGSSDIPHDSNTHTRTLFLDVSKVTHASPPRPPPRSRIAPPPSTHARAETRARRLAGRHPPCDAPGGGQGGTIRGRCLYRVALISGVRLVGAAVLEQRHQLRAAAVHLERPDLLAVVLFDKRLDCLDRLEERAVRDERGSKPEGKAGRTPHRQQPRVLVWREEALDQL